MTINKEILGLISAIHLGKFSKSIESESDTPNFRKTTWQLLIKKVNIKYTWSVRLIKIFHNFASVDQSSTLKYCMPNK
jgi:hypothetical protein